MEKSKIEWTDATWNPVSGCYHECPYCYARGTATRFKGCDDSPEGHTDKLIVYLKERQHVTCADGVVRKAAYPYGFTPTFHEYRLNDPVSKGFGKTVFVCSMADLFGDWIPDDWIIKVFESCLAAPNHRYLFLTKNPDRYTRLREKGLLPEHDNFWYGTTITKPGTPAFVSKKHHTFVSVEPILAPFSDFESSTIMDTEWVIFGAETGHRKDKVLPLCSWFENMVYRLQEKGIAVFMKDSLIPIWGDDIITEFPWDEQGS